MPRRSFTSRRLTLHGYYQRYVWTLQTRHPVGERFRLTPAAVLPPTQTISNRPSQLRSRANKAFPSLRPPPEKLKSVTSPSFSVSFTLMRVRPGTTWKAVGDAQFAEHSQGKPSRLSLPEKPPTVTSMPKSLAPWQRCFARRVQTRGFHPCSLLPRSISSGQTQPDRKPGLRVRWQIRSLIMRPSLFETGGDRIANRFQRLFSIFTLRGKAQTMAFLSRLMPPLSSDYVRLPVCRFHQVLFNTQFHC